jgi:CheY-like chemotaxis protein
MRKTSPTDVLLVEDNQADIYVIRRAIADCSPHIRLWLISRGEEAIAFLRHEPPFEHVPFPALILLDLVLPGREGLNILEELRSVPAYSTIPVVILSGNE